VTALRRQTVLITASERLNPDFFRLTVEFPELARDALPGQFVTLAVPFPGLQILRRPFSIHRVTPGGHVQLLIKVVGQCTMLLAETRPGRTVDVLGPLGCGVFNPAADRPRVLLVAGGVGIAPFLFLADRLVSNARWRPALLYGGATADDLVTLDQYAALGVPVHVTTEDGSQGRRGLVTGELRDQLDALDPATVQVLACGPMPMLKAVSSLCAERGVPCQVSLENLMACGVGSCRGCVVPVVYDASGEGIPYARVCHEGPVFDARQIDWGLVP
jgi:dihydroorotate dehydrogenase electron transfer subunit